MKQKKLLFFGMIMLVLVSWAPFSQASIVISWGESFFNSDGIGDPNMRELGFRYQLMGGGDPPHFEDFQASTPGTYSQTISFLAGWRATVWNMASGVNPTPPGVPDSCQIDLSHERIYIVINSCVLPEGQPAIDEVTWSAKYSDGTAWHTLGTISGSNEYLQGLPPPYSSSGWWSYEFETCYDGSMTVPLTWYGDLVSGEADFLFDFSITQTVHVVPLPATLLLFVSGLGGLAIYGRRKMHGKI